MIGCAGGIGIMLGDAQVGLVDMMQQPVEHMGRLAHGRGNDARVEGPVLAGNVRVHHCAGFDAIFGIYRTAASRAAPGPKILPV